MPRSFWSGAIQFGLVYIPIKLFSAVKHREVVFHEVHDKDGKRIYEKRFCTADNREVTYDHIAKGYQLSARRTVLLTRDELERLEPPAARSIAIEDFVRLEEIDPVYFLNTYYVVPEGGARQAYAVLQRAMLETNKVAIGRTVIRQKQYLVALRPYRDVIMMETMIFSDELVPVRNVTTLGRSKVGARELATAKRIVADLSKTFTPAKYRDTYRSRVLALIKKKSKGQEITKSHAEIRRATQVDELLAQLQESMQKSGAVRKSNAVRR